MTLIARQTLKGYSKLDRSQSEVKELLKELFEKKLTQYKDGVMVYKSEDGKYIFTQSAISVSGAIKFM